jgi:hypothetical protein
MKVAVSNRDVIEIFQFTQSSSRAMARGLTHALTGISNNDLPGGEGGEVRPGLETSNFAAVCGSIP